MKGKLVIFLCVYMNALVWGYRHYQDAIPNGDRVPHPCKDNFLWHGIGHKNTNGGGDLNPFGEDFKAQGHKWTKVLCQKDSDGDGKSNGEELGDPKCVWTKGAFAQGSQDITHPGICDPFESNNCKQRNTWVDCTGGEFTCDAIKEPGVQTVTLRYPPTRVPPTETNYYCHAFDMSKYIDMTTDFHLIGFEPVINNSNVMHHISLMACDKAEVPEHPTPCYMSLQGCNPQTLAIWTLGMAGSCTYKEAGFPIGKHGKKIFIMQHHWTNPELRTDYIDSSGLKLYYTPNLRKYNAGTFLTGQIYLEIPPGQNRVTFDSVCTEHCTNKLIKDRIFLTEGLSHMHYLGYMQTVESFRNGEKRGDVIYDPNYSYDNPQVHVYKNPLEIRSGDELKTTCVFRSLSKKKTTMEGEGSFDEMCFGIFTYFPKENLTQGQCFTWNNFDMCDFDEPMVQGCDMAQYGNKTSDMMRNIINEVMSSCNHFGKCRPECPAVVEKVRKNPCFSGKLGEFLESNAADQRDVDMIKLTHALHSCDDVMNGHHHHWGYSYGESGGITTAVSMATLILSAIIAV